MIEILERKHVILVTEFDRYVVEHPEFAAEIPRNAQIVLQVEGDEEYNKWSRGLAERQREPNQKVAYVKVKGLKPARSRLLKPEVAVHSGKGAEPSGERGTSR
jgi:hypothetical protein